MFKLIRFDEKSKGYQKNIINMAFPVFMGYIWSTVYQIVDTVWLARYSYEAAAAAATAAFVENVMYALVLFVTLGITVLISNRIGKKNYGEVKSYIIYGWVLCLILTLVVATTGFIFRNEICGLLLSENSSKIIDSLKIILSIIFPGSIILYTQCMIDSIFHGCNDTKTPMKSALIANIINMCIDPILIFGLLGAPKMGVAGAFVATLIGRVCGLGWSAYKLLKLPLLNELRQIKPEWKFIKTAMEILKVGIPLALEFLVRMVSSVLLLRIISIYGDIQIAAYGICTKIIIIITSAFFGIRQASSIFLSRRCGEGCEEETKDIGVNSTFIAVAVAVFSAFVLLVGGKNIAWMFTDNVNVVQACILVLNYLSFYLIPFAFNVSLGGSFIGSENGRLLLVITSISIVISLSLCYVISSILDDVSGVWLGQIIAATLQAIMLFFSFYKFVLPKTYKPVEADISLNN
ncbi:MAG: MATE family efflux transporter [Ruminiclostridium sp.]